MRKQSIAIKDTNPLEKFHEAILPHKRRVGEKNEMQTFEKNYILFKRKPSLYKVTRNHYSQHDSARKYKVSGVA